MDILVRHLDRCCCSLCSNALFASLMFRSLEPNSIQSNCVTTKYTMWITLEHTHTHPPIHSLSLSPKCTAHAVQFDFDFGFASSKGYPFEHMLETFFSVSKIREIEKIENKQVSKQAKWDYSFIRLQQWFSNRIFEHIKLCARAHETRKGLC